MDHDTSSAVSLGLEYRLGLCQDGTETQKWQIPWVKVLSGSEMYLRKSFNQYKICAWTWSQCHFFQMFSSGWLLSNILKHACLKHPVAGACLSSPPTFFFRISHVSYMGNMNVLQGAWEEDKDEPRFRIIFKSSSCLSAELGLFAGLSFLIYWYSCLKDESRYEEEVRATYN